MQGGGTIAERFQALETPEMSLVFHQIRAHMQLQYQFQFQFQIPPVPMGDVGRKDACVACRYCAVLVLCA